MGKKVLMVIGVIAMASIFITSIVAAKPGPTPADKFKHADRNKDGVVDRKEAKMERKWEKKQILKRTDKDKDLVPDKLEGRASVDKKWEAEADTNKDGVVDAVEIAQWKASHPGRRVGWKHNKAKVNTPIEAKYDKNGNGWLEPAEAKDMIRDKHIMVATHGKAKVDSPLEAEYDTNKDGMIDPVEAKAMKEDTKS